MRLRSTRRAVLYLGWACALLLSRPALAHQFLQGRAEVVIYADKLTLWASVPIEEVVVQLTLPVNDDGVVATQSDAYRNHGKYLLSHFHLSADDKPLAGKVASIQEPEHKEFVPGVQSKDYVVYELEYALDARPAKIAVRQDILKEIEFTPGVPWQMTFIAGIHQDQKAGKENMLLDSSSKLSFECDWSTPPTQPAATSSAARNAPPESLKKPLPEPEPPRHGLEFTLGIASGIAIVAALIFLFTRLKRKSSGNE
jgi:hypothetical protein